MLFGYLYTLDDKDSFNHSDSDMSYDYFNNNTSTNQYLSSLYSQSDDIIDSVEHTVINNTSEYTLQHQYRSSISEEVIKAKKVGILERTKSRYLILLFEYYRYEAHIFLFDGRQAILCLLLCVQSVS